LIHRQYSALARTDRSLHVSVVTKPTVDSSQLSVDERLELIDQLWESVVRDAPERLELSADYEAEIERRSAELRTNPGLAIPWDVVRTRLLNNLERGR
jgi:putative addiction module component (TIGR02574 family)